MATTLSSVRAKSDNQKYCGFQIATRDDNVETTFYWPIPSQVTPNRHAVLIKLEGTSLSGTHMEFNPRTGVFESKDLQDSDALAFYNRLGLVADILPPVAIP